ncbi:hypothetical protein J3A83DRAFT_4357538 [Scleroderma citrinum]
MAGYCEQFDTCAKPSFETANQLFGWLGSLPVGPQWQSTKINTSGYETTEEVHLIWCDSLEVMKDLFSNPMFVKYMTYSPQEVRCGEEHEYSEFFTGTHAFAIQAQLPIRSTIVPIILVSDKTLVTHQTGGLEMHPLFLTIGNIQSDIQMQATSHAWCSHIFHRSLDMVTASLKVAAKDGTGLVNPSGNIQSCYTPLIMYIVDLPKQQLITGVAKNASLVTMAELSQFGDPTPAAPQMHEKILCQIQEACSKAHPWDLVAFQKAAKSLKLLGIHLPFWCNWMFEILHTRHKFFFDHILGWCKVAASLSILNTHFSSLHQHISFHHFSSGISQPLQMTDPIHTDSLIAAMQQALMDFHSTKQSILDLQAQRGSSGAINHF